MSFETIGFVFREAINGECFIDQTWYKQSCIMVRLAVRSIFDFGAAISYMKIARPSEQALNKYSLPKGFEAFGGRRLKGA